MHRERASSIPYSLDAKQRDRHAEFNRVTYSRFRANEAGFTYEYSRVTKAVTFVRQARFI
jgi:hypothetical protein